MAVSCLWLQFNKLNQINTPSRCDAVVLHVLLQNKTATEVSCLCSQLRILQHCHVGITYGAKLKRQKCWVTSSGMMFMPVLIKFCQFVQKGTDTRLDTSCDIIVMVSFLIKQGK
jgi:hypothetical protein